MTQKIGRNDPCPCGSGKKYKQCCGKPAAPVTPPDDAHEGAATRALAWLELHHRKAFAAALQNAMKESVHELFDDEDQALEALTRISEPLWQNLQINLSEWLLAEGDMWVKGAFQRVPDLLLGPGGPTLTTGQRAWLAQLARQPLRLYDVTEVVPGVGVTVCDALDTGQPPLVVDERAGSLGLTVGMQLGARVMAVGERHQFSGAMYPFFAGSGGNLLASLRALAGAPGTHPQDDSFAAGLILIEGWLAQYLLPAESPVLMDASSGEPLLFVSDHYAVRDWAVLSAALAAQPDVTGDRQAGWDRLHEGDDGQTRSQAMLRADERDGQGMHVLYKTAGLAQRGRAWFDALAGDAVTFDARSVSSPEDLRPGGSGQGPAASQALDASALADAIESVIKRSYANWADEPIPALGARTPRQAMQHAAGLERVKGLLRSYEDSEAVQAAQQGRRAISYQFLWDALNLQRQR